MFRLTQMLLNIQVQASILNFKKFEILYTFIVDACLNSLVRTFV